MSLKLVNIIVLYIVKRYVRSSDEDSSCKLSPTSSNPADLFELCDCPLMNMGYQFFWLMITDLVVRHHTTLFRPAVLSVASSLCPSADATVCVHVCVHVCVCGPVMCVSLATLWSAPCR